MLGQGFELQGQCKFGTACDFSSPYPQVFFDHHWDHREDDHDEHGWSACYFGCDIGLPDREPTRYMSMIHTWEHELEKVSERRSCHVRPLLINF